MWARDVRGAGKSEIQSSEARRFGSRKVEIWKLERYRWKDFYFLYQNKYEGGSGSRISLPEGSVRFKLKTCAGLQRVHGCGL